DDFSPTSLPCQAWCKDLRPTKFHPRCCQ
ncbi:hypothetical protein EE612_057616, partial [Oryza sativa]